MRASVLLFAFLATACGSSSERPQQTHDHVPTTPAADDAGAPATSSTVRTLKTVPLFGGSAVHNLLIDPTFGTGNPGIGRWISSASINLYGNGPAVAQLVTVASPLGSSMMTGSVTSAGSDGASHAFTLVAQVPGGTGPYRVRVWIATDQPLPDTTPLDSIVRVTLADATKAGSSLSGTDVPAGATRVVDGRTWTRFEAEAPGPFTLGAYLVLRFKNSKARFLLQSPEVVPAALDATSPVTGSTMALVIGAPLRRTLDAEEAFGIDRYRRQPLQY